MTIEEKDFRLTSTSDESILFDLELAYTIRPKNKPPRIEFQVAAYGIDLLYALKTIAQFRISHRHPDKAITLKQYIDEYKSEINDLKCLLK